MANITFTSPLLTRDKIVYAIAGNTKTVLGLAEEYKIPIPFECQNGNCGSCLIEVDYPEPQNTMSMSLTEKEKGKLKELGVLTDADIEKAEVSDLPPKYRLACQYIARDEEVTIRFSGEPGGA